MGEIKRDPLLLKCVLNFLPALYYLINICNRVSYFFLLFCFRDDEEETAIKKQSDNNVLDHLPKVFQFESYTWITAYWATTKTKHIFL